MQFLSSLLYAIFIRTVDNKYQTLSTSVVVTPKWTNFVLTTYVLVNKTKQNCNNFSRVRMMQDDVMQLSNFNLVFFAQACVVGSGFIQFDGIGLVTRK